MKTYRTVTTALFAAAAAIFQLVHGIVGIPSGFGLIVDLAGLPVLLAFFMFGFESALSVCILLAIIITFVSPETWLGASMKFAATLPMIMVPALWLLAGKRKNDIGRIAGIAAISILLPLALFVVSGFTNTSLDLRDGEVLYAVPEVKAGESVILPGSQVTSAILLGGIAPIAILTLAAVGILALWKRYGKELDLSSLEDRKSIVLITALAIVVRGIAMVIANYYYAGPIFFGISPEQFMSAVPWYVVFGWNAFQGAVEMGFAWTIAFKFRFSHYYGSS
jgi:riboflavin transporter FmnP